VLHPDRGIGDQGAGVCELYPFRTFLHAIRAIAARDVIHDVAARALGPQKFLIVPERAEITGTDRSCRPIIRDLDAPLHHHQFLIIPPVSHVISLKPV
jgi:hypothetical protein